MELYIYRLEIHDQERVMYFVCNKPSLAKVSNRFILAGLDPA